MIAQLKCLSEQTHSENKVPFGLEYKTKQMVSSSNNVLDKQINWRETTQTASYISSLKHSHRKRDPSTLNDWRKWRAKIANMIRSNNERRFTPVGEGGSGRRPLPPQTLSILVDFTLKQVPLHCIFGLDLK